MVSSLSILIPVYNRDVTALVKQLQAQCQQLPLQYEIRLYDDASQPNIQKLNQALADHPDVVYHELPSNIGRAAIRNALAQDARYDFLLLLDNDCLPVSNDFLANYLKAAGTHDVVLGGITYISATPKRAFRLHWKYGRQRGARSAAERQQTPYKDIYLCNALIQKELFLRFPLRASLTGYGHEDTVFAQELQACQVPVKHIENPVLHIGLEQSEVLLEKTQEAVQNLVQLYAAGEELRQLKLIQTFQVMQSAKVNRIYTAFFSRLEPLVLQNLSSAYPSLLCFDLYRLYLFTKLQNR
ncbi:glycosyltransferase family 2 protein [Pontibacter sp. CAU 1760]